MKKAICIIGVILATTMWAGVAFGDSDSTTPRLNLTVPGIGTSGYAPKVNNDLVRIDSGTAVLAKENVFTGTNTFGVPVGTASGGTGKNWVAVSTGSLPYFSANGIMDVLAAGSASWILTGNGAAAPVFMDPTYVAVGSALTASTAAYANHAATSTYADTAGSYTLPNPVTISTIQSPSGQDLLLKTQNPLDDIELRGAESDGFDPGGSIVLHAGGGFIPGGVLIEKGGDVLFYNEAGYGDTTIGGGPAQLITMDDETRINDAYGIYVSTADIPAPGGLGVRSTNAVFAVIGSTSTSNGTALLGSNSPANSLSAPTYWLTVKRCKLDGTDCHTGYSPVWE